MTNNGNKWQLIKFLIDQWQNSSHGSRVATVREKVLENEKKFPGQGKVRELHFQSGIIEINEKSHGKVREFQNFPKKDAS